MIKNNIKIFKLIGKNVTYYDTQLSSYTNYKKKKSVWNKERCFNHTFKKV